MTHFIGFGFFDRFSDKIFWTYPLLNPLIMLSCDLRLFCKQERIITERSQDYEKIHKDKINLFQRLLMTSADVQLINISFAKA